MDLMGMMGKLKETQRKIEETKLRLDSVLIDEQSADGTLKVTFKLPSVLCSSIKTESNLSFVSSILRWVSFNLPIIPIKSIFVILKFEP